MATISIDAFKRLLAVNAKGVERTGARIFHATRRPWCDTPVPRHVLARGKTRGGLENGNPYHLDIWVPCRKCERCRAYRRMDWRARIGAEIAMSEKNWFVTLTFRPDARKKLFMEEQNGVWTLREASSRNTIAMREVSLYLKRLRAGLSHMDSSQSRLRYVAVTEDHKDGVPHIHMIIHCGADYRKTAVQAGWKHGFLTAKLCDADASSYLTKYLTKEVSRVRASLNYGLGSPGRSPSLSPEDPNDVSKKGSAGKGRMTSKDPSSPHGGLGQVARAEDLSPEAILGAQMYNREISLEDHATVFATLVSMREEFENARAVKTPVKAGRPRKSSERSGKGLAECAAEGSVTQPDADRPASGCEGGEDNAGSDPKASTARSVKTRRT